MSVLLPESFGLAALPLRHPFTGILQSSLLIRYRSLQFRMIHRVRRFFNDLTVASIRKKAAKVNEKENVFNKRTMRLFKR